MEKIVEFNDWEKLDLRVGQIISVEDIPDADNLYKLTIDLGDKKQTVCAGIKQYYSKEELREKKIILFANLAPRILKGIKSEGMILAAGSKESDKCVLISPEKDIELGSKVS